MDCWSSDRILVRKGSAPSESCPTACPNPQAFNAAAKLNNVSLVSKRILAVGGGAGAAGGRTGTFAGLAGVAGPGFSLCATTGTARARHKNAARLRFPKTRGQNF